MKIDHVAVNEIFNGFFEALRFFDGYEESNEYYAEVEPEISQELENAIKAEIEVLVGAISERVWDDYLNTHTFSYFGHTLYLLSQGHFVDYKESKFQKIAPIALQMFSVTRFIEVSDDNQLVLHPHYFTFKEV